VHQSCSVGVPVTTPTKRPRPLTAFTSDEIYSNAWSKDGRTLALSRGALSADVVV
jgi:hypothetical protein